LKPPRPLVDLGYPPINSERMVEFLRWKYKKNISQRKIITSVHG
jgi:hypothetical protein